MSESIATPWISRRAGALLVGLVAVHVAINLFFNPMGTSYPGGFSLAQVAALGVIGTFVSQPALLALAAAYAPLRPTVRIPVTFAITILLCCTLIWSAHRNSSSVTSGAEYGMLALEYGIFLAVAAAWGRLRRWRIVPRPADSGLRGRQFSMRGLFMGITGLSLVFAACYWTMPLARWPMRGTWEAFAVELFAAALVLAAVNLPLLCATALILAERSRLVLWVVAAGSMVAGVALLPPLLHWLIQAGNQNPDIVIFACAVYLSGLISLCVVRACGFRLQRMSSFEARDNNLAQSSVSP